MGFDRIASLSWLRTSPEVPVLIIGGGINGAGVLRELAINGVDALLVDKSDFAAGASGASSRMIHGGLRYLEHGEFRLVRESLRERNLLLRNAPHAVFPLATVIPLFSHWAGLPAAIRKFLRLGGRPGGRRGSWLVRIGLALYARYAGRDDPLPPRSLASGRKARWARPDLHSSVLATATYYDAWNPSPERLNLEVITDALRAHPGAQAVNHLAVTGLDGGAVTLCDEVSGELFSIRPQIVVNASGAWIDRTNRHLGEPSYFIGGTKGSHMVVDHPELHAQLQGAEIFYENRDGRICIILPLHGRVLIGATDIRADDPDAVRCEAEELAYLATAVRQVFPNIDLGPERVISRFCGVRPLARSTAGSTGAISRDHSCQETPPNASRPFPILSLVGGKWTTFRALAALAADRIFSRFGKLRLVHSLHLPIGGGREHPGKGQTRERWINHVAEQTGIARELVAVWFARHGTTAAAIAAHVHTLGDGAGTWIRDWHEGEIDYVCRHEAVVHLEDLVIRRTTLALFSVLDRPNLERCGAIAARVLGWSPSRTTAELERTEKVLRERHGVRW